MKYARAPAPSSGIIDKSRVRPHAGFANRFFPGIWVCLFGLHFSLTQGREILRRMKRRPASTLRTVSRAAKVDESFVSMLAACQCVRASVTSAAQVMSLAEGFLETEIAR